MTKNPFCVSICKLQGFSYECVLENNFLISQPKHMLWVLKRTVSMRLFFLEPKTYAKTDG